MLGKIISWFLSNWEAVSAIIGLVAATVAAWKRGSNQAKQADTAKQVAVTAIAKAENMTAIEAEKEFKERQDMTAQANASLRRMRKQAKVRYWRESWEDAKDFLGGKQ